jgi:hypothetical protein
MSLHDMASASINTILHEVRANLVPSSSVSGNYQSPAAHCNNEAPAVPEDEPSSDSEAEVTGQQRRAVTIEDVVDDEVEERRSRKRNRDDSSEEEEWDPSSSDACRRPLARPSEYLRTRCPLCFGGTG